MPTDKSATFIQYSCCRVVRFYLAGINGQHRVERYEPIKILIKEERDET